MKYITNFVCLQKQKNWTNILKSNPQYLPSCLPKTAWNRLGPSHQLGNYRKKNEEHEILVINKDNLAIIEIINRERWLCETMKSWIWGSSCSYQSREWDHGKNVANQGQVPEWTDNTYTV